MQVLMCLPQRFCKSVFMHGIHSDDAALHVLKLRQVLRGQALLACAPTVNMSSVLRQNQILKDVAFSLNFAFKVTTIIIDAPKVAEVRQHYPIMKKTF